MFFLILGLILLVIGFVIWHNVYGSGVGMIATGLVLLFIFVCGVVITPMIGKASIIEYECYVEWKDHSGSELMISKYNAKIRKTREFMNNFFVGIFYYKPYGELSLLKYNYDTEKLIPVEIR